MVENKLNMPLLLRVGESDVTKSLRSVESMFELAKVFDVQDAFAQLFWETFNEVLYKIALLEKLAKVNDYLNKLSEEQ